MRPGGAHCDQALTVEGRAHCDLALAVEEGAEEDEEKEEDRRGRL